MSTCFLVSNSRFGEFTIIWAPKLQLKVRRILLPSGARQVGDLVEEVYPGIVESYNKDIKALAHNIAKFLEGQDVHFDINLLDFGQCTIFQGRVILAEYHIPRGWVSTYKRIAEHLCVANGSKAVGNALAANPFPIIIPCHRAVMSDGSIKGYQGGSETKRRLLMAEGVRFKPDGKVRMEKVYY